jgi:hypothetical protein
MRPRRVGYAIFFTVFFAYLLTSSREPPWGDARGMYDAGHNLVTKGSMAIGFPWPEDIPRGRGDQYYCISPIMTSLVHVPGVIIHQALTGLFPHAGPMIKPITSHLAPAALGALICVLLFFLCRELGARTRTASMVAAISAFATTIWVYARYPYSEILQAAAFTGFFLALLCAVREPSRRRAVMVGLWAGVLLNAKYVYALAIVGGALFIAFELRRDRRALLTTLAWAAAAGLPFAALAVFYNWLRWGAITETGYGPYLGAFFGGSLFDGAWGQLLSSNKSAFLFSPPLVLSMLGMGVALVRAPRYLRAVALTLVPVFLVYSTYRSWSGDYAWGPRFFVFAVPVLLAPLALYWEARLARARRWLAVSVLGTFVAAGVIVQLLGSGLYWDHFIRVSMEARSQWLGKPDRSGSYIDARGRGHCDSCFEDMHAVQWLPPFSQIKGHAWLLSSLARGHDWKAAEARAPWHRYTALKLNIRQSHDRARLDWWAMLWIRDFPRYRVAGVLLLVLFLAGTAGGAWWWIRGQRRARGHDEESLEPAHA